ncbi:hypothetical protein V8E53_003358 [Lactarius tabidus]
MNPFVVLTAFIALASAFTVNTPTSVVTCEPVKFTWDPAGSKAPYYLSLVPANQPGADPLKEFPPQDGDSYTWEKVDLPPNTSFTTALKDSDGNQVYSAPATVRAGSNTNCPNAYAADANSPTSPSSTKVDPGVAAATPSGGSTSSHAAAAAASSSPSSSSSQGAAPKTAAASPSGSNASPSQSPSVKANSAARGGSSVVIEMVVGLLSVAVFLMT